MNKLELKKMNHSITLYVALREAVQRLVFSRRFVRESITRSQALSVRRNLKQLEKENTTSMY